MSEMNALNAGHILLELTEHEIGPVAPEVSFMRSGELHSGIALVQIAEHEFAGLDDGDAFLLGTRVLCVLNDRLRDSVLEAEVLLVLLAFIVAIESQKRLGGSRHQGQFSCDQRLERLGVSCEKQ